MEVYDDSHLENMWGGFVRMYTVEVFIEETQKPPRFVLKLVKGLREAKKIVEAKKLKKIVEEKGTREGGKKKNEKRWEVEEALRELEDQLPPVAIEIPIYNMVDLSAMEYFMIFTQREEEFVMGE